MKFLKSYSDIITENGIDFVSGLWITIYITAVSLIFSVLIGIGIGYLNTIPVRKKSFSTRIIKLFQWLGRQYIDLIRGTPLLVQAIFFYFGVVPLIINPLLNRMGIENMSAEISGIIVISLNAGAYLSEIFRG